MFFQIGDLERNEASGRHIYSELWPDDSGYYSDLFKWMSAAIVNPDELKLPDFANEIRATEHRMNHAFVSHKGSQSLVLGLTSTDDDQEREADTLLDDEIKIELIFLDIDWVLEITLTEDLKGSTQILSELCLFLRETGENLNGKVLRLVSQA